MPSSFLLCFGLKALAIHQYLNPGIYLRLKPTNRFGAKPNGFWKCTFRHAEVDRATGDSPVLFMTALSRKIESDIVFSVLKLVSELNTSSFPGKIVLGFSWKVYLEPAASIQIKDSKAYLRKISLNSGCPSSNKSHSLTKGFFFAVEYRVCRALPLLTPVCFQ